jgi:hypothetical protein
LLFLASANATHLERTYQTDYLGIFDLAHGQKNVFVLEDLHMQRISRKRMYLPAKFTVQAGLIAILISPFPNGINVN